MDKGIINEPLLEKNIVQITYYGDEENKLLNKITKKFEEGTNNYKSKNTSSFLRNINILRNNTSLILTKRMAYANVLTRVIAQYHKLSDETVDKFSGGKL